MDRAAILTPAQERFLAAIFSDEWFRRHFYLTGGTALAAFHLYHRFSDDLDFFSHGVEVLPVRNLIADIGKRLGLAVESVHSSPGFLRFQVGEGLKIDVVADIEFRVGVPELRENFMVDSLKNIAVNKVCAILGRLDAKDYVDLRAILRSGAWDIFELMDLAHRKDAGMDTFVWASLIGEVGRLAVMPRLVEPLSRDELNRFFLELRDTILDRLKPR